MKMKNVGVLLRMAMMGAVLLLETARASEYFPRWVGRLDMGGTIPLDANITEFGGPMGDGKLKLSPGFQMDLALGWRATPWLELGPELGFTFNSVDSIGGWSYPDTTLGQILMMANVRLEYPSESRLAPFIGAGIGGAASFLTFGANDWGYYYEEPDGEAQDISLAFQAFGGLRYSFSEKCSLGVVYRYLFTDRQHWDVDWWTGPDFDIEVDSIRMHSICLVFSLAF